MAGEQQRKRDYFAQQRGFPTYTLYRNSLAQAKGFKNYADERKQFHYASRSRDFYAAGRNRPVASSPEDVNKVKLFYRAFKVSPDHYSTSGPKAQWFVEEAEIITYDEWTEHYPRGIRDYTGGLAA